MLSLKCGGSDYTSGLASNPTLGRVTDRLVALGGTAVLGEIAEIMGAEHLLASRATRPATATKLIQIITRVETEARALGLDIRGTQPSPGNIRGGLTTIEEKSLGATHKGGEVAPLEDVVGYSAPITRKGLTVMDTPGLDVESVTGMVGGGAQVVVFTTGLGTPTGNPIAPVIKVTGNARTARQMADNIDLDVSGIMDDSETLDAAADRLFAEVLAVASGQQTSAETARTPRVRDSPPQSDHLTRRARCRPELARLSTDRASVPPPTVTGPIGRYRWIICALLFFAATINYIDRQVIGILKPTLQGEFGWSEIDYADIVFAFQLAYAIGFLLAGRMIDWLGTKRGFSVALVVWSLAAMAHAEATVFGPAAASVPRARRARPTRRLSPASSSPGSRSDSARRATSRRRSRSTAEWFPEEGARARHGPLQLGHQRRRAAHAARGAVDHAALGLVLGVRHHRRARLHLAVLLDSAVPVAGTSSAASAPPSWRTSAATRPTRRRTSRGRSC